jgi:hypothetical protein
MSTLNQLMSGMRWRMSEVSHPIGVKTSSMNDDRVGLSVSDWFTAVTTTFTGNATTLASSMTRVA